MEAEKHIVVPQPSEVCWGGNKHVFSDSRKGVSSAPVTKFSCEFVVDMVVVVVVVVVVVEVVIVVKSSTTVVVVVVVDVVVSVEQWSLCW